MRRARFTALLAALAIGCGARQPVPILADLARLHDGAASKDAERFAPQAWAEAENLRKEADATWKAGDDVGAALTAERALAAYDRARALARLARAESDRSAAEAERARNEGEVQSLSATRAELVRDGKELEKRITIATEARLPASCRGAHRARCDTRPRARRRWRAGTSAFRCCVPAGRPGTAARRRRRTHRRLRRGAAAAR